MKQNISSKGKVIISLIKALFCLVCFFVSFPSLPIFGYVHNVSDTAGNQIEIPQGNLSSFLGDGFYASGLKGAMVSYFVLSALLFIGFALEALGLFRTKAWFPAFSCFFAAVTIVLASISLSHAFPIWLVIDLLLLAIMLVTLTPVLLEKKRYKKGVVL